MTEVPVLEWLDEVLGLPAPGTGKVRGSRLAYSAILGVLVGEEALRALGVQVDGALLESSDVFRHVYEVTMGRLAQSVLEGVPRRLRGLLLRAVASTAIASGEISSVRDEVLLDWLRGIAPVTVARGGCGVSCLLEAVASGQEGLDGLVYGLRRLARMALVERRVSPLDYSAVVIYLSGRHEAVAAALARVLLEFFDTDSILASELSYQVLALLVFGHGSALPEDIAGPLRLMAYSPDTVVACRARQLLHRELDARVIDEGYPKPCMAVAEHRGEAQFYVFI